MEADSRLSMACIRIGSAVSFPLFQTVENNYETARNESEFATNSYMKSYNCRLEGCLAPRLSQRRATGIFMHAVDGVNACHQVNYKMGSGVFLIGTPEQQAGTIGSNGKPV